MFLPLIIAILLGLVSPATNSNASCRGGGTVQVNSDPVDPGAGDDPGTGGTGTGGTGGGTGGTGGGGTGGGGTGGDSGQIPPPKP